MNVILHIARCEFRRMFSSPLAWCVLGITQLLMGVVFLLTLVEYEESRPFLDPTVGVSEAVTGGLFGFGAVIFLLLIPIITMRSFSEERGNGSLDLLRSAPVTLLEIVMGKYLGLLFFIGLLTILLLIMPLSLIPIIELDLGRIFAGLLGMFLMMAAFAAAGLFVSSLTDQPATAAVGGFGLLLLLWLINWIGGQNNLLAEVFQYLSLLGHYDKLLRGVFSLSDVVYYLLFCLLFLTLTVLRLDWERQA